MTDLMKAGHPALATIWDEDVNIMFNNRVVNLKKVYPYLPESLNRVLLHFSKGSKEVYATATQLLTDLRECRSIL